MTTSPFLVSKMHEVMHKFRRRGKMVSYGGPPVNSGQRLDEWESPPSWFDSLGFNYMCPVLTPVFLELHALHLAYIPF
jgi:hypothetical protein